MISCVSFVWMREVHMLHIVSQINAVYLAVRDADMICFGICHAYYYAWPAGKMTCDGGCAIVG